MIQIPNALFSHIKTIWDPRNSDNHRPPTDEMPGYRRLMFQSKVESLYDQESKVLSIDKQYFSSPLAEKLQDTNAQLDHYINFHKDLIKHSIKKAKDMGPNFCPIQSYFQPTTNPPNQPIQQQPSIPEHLSDILQPFP